VAESALWTCLINPLPTETLKYLSEFEPEVLAFWIGVSGLRGATSLPPHPGGDPVEIFCCSVGYSAGKHKSDTIGVN
jgi:hypothetical protein